MANAYIDSNGVRTVTGTLQSDGQTIVRLRVNPANNRIKMIDGTSGTASARKDAPRDENNHPAWMGVSAADGVTPIPIAMDANGNLLTKST